MPQFQIKTSKKREVIDITSQVASFLAEEDLDQGAVNLFVKHTTAALSTADLDPGTDQDYLKVFEKLVPELDYNHPHDPGHFPDHFLSTAVGVSLTIPVENGSLQLGAWQKIVLLEFNGPKEREIILTFLSNSV